MTIHATTVAIRGRAVVIEGPSGSGKSDLALRLIDRGALLVADDRTVLRRDGDALYASCPATIAGLLEVRGLGVIEVEQAGETQVALWVAIGASDRLPQPATHEWGGVAVPALTIAALEASAPLKVELALR